MPEGPQNQRPLQKLPKRVLMTTVSTAFHLMTKRHQIA